MTARALTVADFAAAYSIPVQTVRKMIRQQRIRAINFGTPQRPVYRIPLAECERFEARAA